MSPIPPEIRTEANMMLSFSVFVLNGLLMISPAATPIPIKTASSPMRSVLKSPRRGSVPSGCPFQGIHSGHLS